MAVWVVLNTIVFYFINNYFGDFMTIRYYEVEGNLAADKSSEAFPTMALCDNCVCNYTVIARGAETTDSCEADGDECESLTE